MHTCMHTQDAFHNLTPGKSPVGDNNKDIPLMGKLGLVPTITKPATKSDNKLTLCKECSHNLVQYLEQ